MAEHVTERTGFLFEGTLDEIDPTTSRITAFEEARQVNKLILIASESAAPPAVRQALASVFTDLYAEGYPATHTVHEPEDLVADVAYQIAYHERYGDRRYYKGTEFADLVEALAQERIRQLFAPNRYPHNGSSLGPDQIQANVQPLSGANANTAVYLALLQPGDTIMGLNLSHGGHLSHGSPVNVSGRLFKVVPYGVNPATGRIDYDEVERLAREHQPRLIVTGASAYPWAIDFVRLRRICDSLPRRAYLLADVSHPAGLVVAGLFPNPVGIADVTTFTTHKTLIGPRAAVILTTNETLARRIDRAVFPGLQGGPHLNTIAALAVAFKIAQQPAFNELQRAIVENARMLAETLARRGLTLAYGGTETHLLLVDLRSIAQPSGVPLNGDVAARILDLAGIVCNKNTILGDVSATYPSGIRLGTPWITQRGLTPDDVRRLGEVIADVLLGITTFRYFDGEEAGARGKIPPDLLRQSQETIADLIARRAVGPAEPPGWPDAYEPAPATVDGYQLYDLFGRRARAFLSEATSGDVWPLRPGEAIATSLLDARGDPIAAVGVLRCPTDGHGLDHFVVAIPADRAAETLGWLNGLSNGLVLFDATDPWAKVDGPVAIRPFDAVPAAIAATLRAAIAAGVAAPDPRKPYFVGQRALVASGSVEVSPPELAPALVTVRSAASIPGERASEGWALPLDYGDPAAELRALHETAGLIDESGLGVVELAGSEAGRFLDLVTTNNVAFLGVNVAQYTFLLDPRGQVIADAILYRIAPDRYWLTTAPSRTAPVVTWLQEILAGRCLVDLAVPTRTLAGLSQVRLAPEAGAGGLSVVGLAGPNAPAVLRALAETPEDRRRIGRLRRFTLTSARLAGVATTVARTGHTGAGHGYEIFVRPDDVQTLWEAALTRRGSEGLRAVGWSAWRQAGITAGLPWFGHELAGPHAVNPVQAGYGPEVRIHKPFFVGRGSLLGQPYPPPLGIARFRVCEGETAIPSDGDPLVDASGVVVGVVTSGPAVPEARVGLAYVVQARAPVGAPLTALAGLGAPTGPGRADRLGEAAPPTAGSRPIAVEVIPRFPKASSGG